MAFRIHDSVVRGEIDNRVKGIVRGKIWLHGRNEPLVLELRGNAWPDLAGCLLTFENMKPQPSRGDIEGLATLQQGNIGDLTASRKVRVWDVPFEEAEKMLRRKQKPPEHMANSLYLEWFSDANGRVVIESVDCALTISAPGWRLSAEDEQQRAMDAAQGMKDFLSRLTGAIEPHRDSQKDPDAWDEHDYEKFFKESDARTQKYEELLEKYGHSEEAQEKIDEEMGWAEELTEEEAEQQQKWVEEINAACEEAASEPDPEPDAHREGIDWIRTESGDVAHPLQHRAYQVSLKFLQTAKSPGAEVTDEDLQELIFAFHMIAAKLAGALGPIARGTGLPQPAFTVAYLKRALDRLHQAQAGLEAVALRKILPDQLVAEARTELFEIRQGILDLMDRYRRE
jgi:hypothetical protein